MVGWVNAVLANATIFMRADFAIGSGLAGAMTWPGQGKDGCPARYVTGEGVKAEPPRLLEYRFGMGGGAVMSHRARRGDAGIRGRQVVVTNDQLGDDDPAYAQNA
jgi:uncharacterized protein YndB with AHSA1/START domain